MAFFPNSDPLPDPISGRVGPFQTLRTLPSASETPLEGVRVAMAWKMGGFPSYPFYRSNLSPKDVQISPSRFVLLQDSGPSNWAVSTQAQLDPYIAGEWWHGNKVTVMSFLDGSARKGKTGLLV